MPQSIYEQALAPCPFCGSSDAYMMTEQDSDGFGFFLNVKCGKCNAQTGQQYVSHGNDCPQIRAEVRDAWNTRSIAILRAAAAEQMEQQSLWCVNVHGPDDVYAMPSKAAALERANELNIYFGRLTETSATREYDPIMRAVVIEWPHSAESHAKAVSAPPPGASPASQRQQSDSVYKAAPQNEHGSQSEGSALSTAAPCDGGSAQ